VNGFLARREAWTALEAGHDFALLADFVDQLALKRSTGAATGIRSSSAS
jgi:methyl-accepting chemotaxis protein